MQPKAAAPGAGAYRRDDYLQDLATFHERARAGHLVARLTSWDDASADEGWDCYALWSAQSLARFEPTVRGVYQPRNLVIECVAEQHRAGTRFWSEHEAGRECLVRLAAWLEAHTPDADDHYVSCNAAHRDVLAPVPGRHVSPRIAGVNDLARMSSATFIYSGKASPQEQAALSTLGVGRDDLVRSREGEDILQMALRGSLRVPDDARTFLFRVYDRTQAEALAEQVAALGLPITVSLHYRDIDIDIDAIGRPKPGPVSRYTSVEEKRAAVREQSRERMRRMRAQRRGGLQDKLGDAA